MCVRWWARPWGDAAHVRSVIIFCRIVDYFGDAGFCWRLSVALRELGIARVLLVIDRLNILDDLRGPQRVEGVTALPWSVVEERWQRHGVPDEHKADVVIEAFACRPPQAYLEALSSQAQWLTLDYLATEPWADQAHGQRSPHPSLLHPIAKRRRWFVPGFSKATGGLLHGRWRHISADERRAWRARLAGGDIDDDTFLVMAFGYADANWQRLLELAQQQRPAGFKTVKVWPPKGIEVSQVEFDEVLQSCDLNFVRGEDSFVRAHWAAAGPWRVPFVWQPYRQSENDHGHKLAGWMDQVLQDPALEGLVELHWAWNGIRPAEAHQALSLPSAWTAFCSSHSRVRDRLHAACSRWAAQPSLEAHLVAAIEAIDRQNP